MNSFCSTFIRYFKLHAAVYWGLLVALFILAEYLFFAADIDFRVHSSHVINLLRLIADISFLLLPYWFLPSKARFTILFFAWSISALFIADAVYYSFFKDLIPFSIMGQTANANDALLKSIPSLLHPRDLIYVFFPVAITVLWCLRPLRRTVASERMSSRTKMTAVALSLLLFLGIQWRNTIAFIAGRSEFTTSEISLHQAVWGRLREKNIPEKTKLENKGMPLYLLLEAYNLLATEPIYSLNAAERKSIDDFVGRHNVVITDSCTGKNLIFIIVESLNSDIVGTRINGRQVTPVIDSLMRMDNTLSCLNVTSQISVGTSSDGQLMLNSGILPLPKEVATQNYIYDGTLPALPRLLSENGYTTAGLFSYDCIAWNQYKSYIAYGFDRITTINDMYERMPRRDMDIDHYLMLYAANYLDSIPEPFFMEVITMGMHYPFWEGKRNNFADENDIPNTMERRYANAVNLFDNALGNFLKALRLKKPANNTTIVIASDHSINMGSGVFPIKPIVFIAHNGGCSGEIKQPVGQVDIFPTMLDILRLKSSWRGVGTSMLRNPCGAIDSRGTLHADDSITPQQISVLSRQWSVSDSILHSDYFCK